MIDKDKIFKKLGRPKCPLVITTYDDKGNPLIQEFEGIREAREGTGLSTGMIYDILKIPRENCKIEYKNMNM